MYGGPIPSSWNKTIEGKQYFISVNSNHLVEFSFDNVNPLVGGGATFEVTSDLKHNTWIWEEIQKVFGLENARVIYALTLTLEKVSHNEIEIYSMRFYEVYDEQIELVLKKKLFREIT